MKEEEEERQKQARDPREGLENNVPKDET